MMTRPAGDLPAIIIPSIGALLAIYLIAVPLLLLIYAAFHGPADFLPFESGAQWTFDNITESVQQSDPLSAHPAGHFDLRRRHRGRHHHGRLCASVDDRAHRPAGPRSLVLADPVPAAGAGAGLRDRMDFVVRSQRGLGQYRDPRPDRLERRRPAQHFQDDRAHHLPVVCDDAVRLPSAHRDVALDGPGAGRSEPVLRRLAADDFPAHHVAGAAAGSAGAADPGDAGDLRAVRTAADHRPAGARQCLRLSDLQRAQPEQRAAQLRRSRRDLHPVSAARARGAAALQSRDPPQPELRHHHRQILSPAAIAARPLALRRALVPRSLYGICRRAAGRGADLDQPVRLRRPRKSRLERSQRRGLCQLPVRPGLLARARATACWSLPARRCW